MTSFALATQTNLLAFYRHLAGSPAVEFLNSPPLVRWHTRLRHPWFDGVISTGPAPANAPELIQANVDYFRSQGVRLFTWWLDPFLPADGWDTHLRAAGFGYDAATPGMALPLDGPPPSAPLPPGLTINVVHDLDALRDFVSVAVVGFDMPATSAPDFFDFMAGLGLDLPIRHYLGTLNGRPVATSSLFLGAGVGGIQFVATVPEARGQGIAAAMTRAAVQDAQSLGCPAAILQSSDMGYRVYERLGFQKIYAVDNYYWRDTNSP